MKTGTRGPAAFDATFLTALVAALFLPSIVWSGPNAGGTLVVHALEGVVYTNENPGYCSPLPDAGGAWAQSCDEVVSTLPDAGSPTVWVVYSAFSEDNHPRLAGVEFGISYSPGLTLLEWGSCADYESAMGAWPASGSGTIVVWNGEREERLVETYWFAGYAYSAATGLTFATTPHPVNGGHFADRSPAPVLDEIVGYGSLGFGTDGYVPCPASGTFLIRPDGTGDYPTIQDALSAAPPTSVIELADGIYTGDGNRDLDFNHTSYTLRSASGDPERCVIDCEGSAEEHHRGILVTPEGDRPSVIQGITIRNGYAGNQIGSGFHQQGGAIRVDGGVLTISSCIFEHCGTDREGGAIAGGGFPLEINDCVFLDNWADGRAGGAMEIGGGAELRMARCSFEGNRLDRNDSSGKDGGAIRIVASSLHAVDCSFSNNEARRGGGVFAYVSEVELERCTLDRNLALLGGAIYANDSEVTVRSSTVSDNGASAGGGIFCDFGGGNLHVSSSIIAFSEEGEAVYCGASSVAVDHSDLYGNADGDWIGCLGEMEGTNGNIDLDPLFCDREESGYGLDRRSPCATVGSVRGAGVMGAWPVSCGGTGPGRSLEDTVAGGEAEMAQTELPAGAMDSGITKLELSPVSPNPLTESTRIEYTIVREGAARLLLFDTSGRQVRALVERGDHSAGPHEVTWDGADDSGNRLPAGIYFLQLSSGGEDVTRRISLIR